MVEFLNQPIGMSVSQYIDLVKLRKVCNSCIGFCISLGKLFYSDGIREVDEEILPMFTAMVAKGISLRVLPSYGIYFGSHFRLVIVDQCWFFNCSTFLFFLCFFGMKVVQLSLIRKN